jgi:hypothetical protein
MAGDSTRKGRPRVYLPSHDFSQYCRFRVRPDFTSFIYSMDKGDEGEETPNYNDLCGFRVASFSRVSVASATSTMTGDRDHYHIEDYEQLIKDAIDRLPGFIDSKPFVDQMTRFIDADTLARTLGEPKFAEYLRSAVGQILESMAAHLNEARDDIGPGFRM